MKIIDAIEALSSLAQETRLLVFRLLVKAGPDGLAAGQIATKLRLSAPTLSFHLKELRSAGLINCTRQSRSLIYTANFSGMRKLVEFLTEDCCDGQPEVCGLPGAPVPKKGKDKAA
ncbi:MAG: transcriptional regulator [Rhodospirillaceae bacterium]|nr:transcriptional regulator [Rhodospirillaceae bacterium]|tara:strand:+ start:10402 stop:10749 length:348 start_codon:yes stop_codon:yes gene_type:complete